MITIEKTKSINTLYVYFDYDKELVKLIKTLPIKERKYDPDGRRWIITTNALPRLVDIVDDYDTFEIPDDINLDELRKSQETQTEEEPEDETIKINVKQSKNYPTYAILSFPYDRDIVDTIKTIPEHAWNDKKKVWIIPYYSLPELANKIEKEYTGVELIIPDEITEKLKEDAVETAPAKERLNGITLGVDDYTFKTNPYPHQIEAFNFGLTHNNILLADDQGLGKTMESLNIIEYKRQTGIVNKCLIICGVNGTKYNWEREIGIHTNATCVIIDANTTTKRAEQLKGWLAPGNETPYAVINIESLRKSEILNIIKAGKIDALIIDEIHKAKNGTSQQGKAVNGLRAKVKIGLTGTPITNKVSDLWNILYFLDAEIYNYYHFRDAFCVMGGYQNKEIVDYKNLKTLNKKLATVMLRRKKEDVIDLPEKIYSTEYVDLTKEEQKKYNQARAGILRDITSGKHLDTSMALTMILRLRQITAGIQSEEIGSKADRIRDLLEEEILPNKGKAIIFTNWSEVATMYRKLLADYSPAYIDGTVDAKQRQAEIDRFQSTDQCNIIIGTIGAMGTGVTLNKATAVIFADKAWTASDNMQAEDRAHRIGTVRPVNIISMVAKGTVDERIEERLVENKDLFEKVVNGKVEKTEVIKFLCDILGVDPLELKRAQKQAKKAEAEKAQAEKAKIAELDAYKRPELQMTGTN